MLFHRGAHEPLAGGSWDARRARYAIDDIVDDALRAFDGESWPQHPADDQGQAGMYDGSAGVAYALHALGATSPVTVDQCLAQSEGESWATGGVGVALALWPQAGGDRLAAVFENAAADVSVNGENDLCFGVTGAVVGATLLFDTTRDERWARIAGDAVRELWRTWVFDRDTRACVWRQKAPEGSRVILGAAHGLAGNVHALLRAAQFQTPEHQRELLDRTVDALTRTALRERGRANWPPRADKPDPRPRVQWCHGAPGVVIALAQAPRHAQLDALLLEAGELTWDAGPLKKGYGLCHGTAGNGFAFLKLHARTRDTKWLDRARRFAMHAIAQWERREQGRYTLYTGDLGLALYLRACIDVDDRLPLLDVL